MLGQESTIPTIGQQLQHILSSLTASLQAIITSDRVQATSTNSAEPQITDQSSSRLMKADSALVKLVLKLTSKAPVQLHEYIRDVEPLLPLPALDEACR